MEVWNSSLLTALGITGHIGVFSHTQTLFSVATRDIKGFSEDPGKGDLLYGIQSYLTT